MGHFYLFLSSFYGILGKNRLPMPSFWQILINFVHSLNPKNEKDYEKILADFGSVSACRRGSGSTVVESEWQRLGKAQLHYGNPPHGSRFDD